MLQEKDRLQQLNAALLKDNERLEGLIGLAQNFVSLIEGGSYTLTKQR